MSTLHAATAFDPIDLALANQELIEVHVVVKDQATDSPLAGVNVLANGKLLGKTDSRGIFEISLTKGTILIFKMIGHGDLQ